TVDIDAGVPIQTIESPSHKLQMTPDIPSNGSKLRVELAPNDTIPNKDLILRYQMGGATTQTTVLTDTTDQGGHFALYLVPALDYDIDEIVPKDVVFLMDTSGSQSGDPLAKAQELMRRMVNGLNPDDTFSIIDFANTTTRLSPIPLDNTSRNRSRALDYINSLTANGGTELLNGIREVLRFPTAERGRLRSIVLLTDGYIGNEAAVIAEVQRELADGNRLYSFGVGSGVNRFLIDRLAEVGRGTSQVIRHDEPTDEVAERFFQQINNPVLTNIELEWQGVGESPEIYPLAAPDLFVNQPLVIFGRKPDVQDGTLNITGTMAGGDRYEQSIPVSFTPGEGSGAIAQLWGRARIKDLMNDMYSGETVSGVEAVTETALAYRLLSQYTAFVAVSEEVRVDPDGTRRTVQVPVELPEGVSYEGIFGPDATVNAGQLATTSRLQTNANFAPPARAAAGASRSDHSTLQLYQPPQVLGRPQSPTDSGVRHGEDTTTQPPVIIAPELEEFEQDDGLEQLERLSGIESLEIMGLDHPLEQAEQTQLETSLAQHLSYALNVNLEESGTVTWQVRVRNGRVTQVLWDEEQSTAVDQDTLNELRRSLQSWQLESDVDVRLTITVAW
ncbi:MAG: after-VIT domain-containing protein, partial [Merismopedia sp. SIO2A8]|nr:after-VIT domain-containing protein [Merismopedia sp. SIO2A8]